MKRLNKKQVLKMFRSDIAPEVRKQFPKDSIAMREAFNSFVDMLNKNGQVSDHQAFTWSNPF